ncbi:MAG: YiaA/YiaB family inner membrane protein [Rhizobiaceae bacterium]
MNESNLLKPSTAWTNFIMASFVIAAGMMSGGIFFLEASFAAKGFYAISAIMLVYTTVSIT